MRKIIFIAGTGRSGTHLIGRTIATHPKVNGRIEKNNTFRLFTKIATKQDYRNSFYINILKYLLRYRLNKIFKNSDKHILEKSHTSIWLFNYLVSTFKNAYFIGIWRDVEPTVNSMLQHNGVLNWYKKLPLQKPNRFLGITKNNYQSFANLTLEQKCTLRWLSHKKELIRLNSLHPKKIILIKYEDFLKDPKSNLEDISHFLDIKNSFNPEEFHLENLNKWKYNLDSSQVEKIYQILEDHNNYT